MVSYPRILLSGLSGDYDYAENVSKEQQHHYRPDYPPEWRNAAIYIVRWATAYPAVQTIPVHARLIDRPPATIRI